MPDHSDPPPDFLRSFFGTQTSVRAVLSDVMTFLATARVGPDAQVTVELVLAETLNNIVEHAYAGAGGAIDLRLDLKEGTLVIGVKDQGKPMPNGRLPDQPKAVDPASLMRADLPEGGWGWQFIHMSASKLAYERDQGKNNLHIDIPLS